MDQTDFDNIRPLVISAVITLNIILNVIVIAVIVKHPQLREDTTTIFILSLTLSDLAQGCTSMPISAAVCSNATPTVRNMVDFLPKLHTFFSVWFTIASMHSLCWVTVYKMIAITKPFRCQQLLSRKRCHFVLAVTWIFGALFGVALSTFVSSWNVSTCLHGITKLALPTSLVAGLILILGIAMPIALKVCATATIFHVIIRTHRQIAEQSNSISAHIEANALSLTSKSIRSGKNVLIVCLVDLVLGIPLTVYIAGVLLGKENAISSSVKFASVWTMFVSTFVNSFLYLLLFQSVRRRTIEMFKEWSRLFSL